MMIQAKNITHFYNTERVLKDVNLDINEGEFVAVIGESGSGKSTLLSILSTLLTPSSGTLEIANVKSEDIKNIDTFRRQNIGFIFQFHYLINYLSVYENITLALHKVYKKDVDALLEELGISDLKERYPYEISGGQRQRVAIARALANKPKVIFADEPTGNLDSKNSRNVFALLKKIAKRDHITVVVATHDLQQAKNADTIYEMNDGHISNYN
jgi:putative ABC transport system ATP-binding protein